VTQVRMDVSDVILKAFALKKKRFYPTVGTFEARKDEEFQNENDLQEHIKGKSPLLKLNVGLVTKFVLDPMHLIFLGVTRRLLMYWIEGTRAVKLSKLSLSVDTYHEANDYLTKMVEDSYSSSDGNQLLIRRKIAEMNSVTNVQDKKEDPCKRKSNESSDDFSSDVDETEVQSMTQHNEESFDTTITYKSGTSSSLCSLKSNNAPVSSRSSNVSSSSTPAIELLLRPVERIISTRDQQNIVLDNILRNLEVNNRVLERPADFPNLPVSNKTEYRCVEELLSKDENLTYMTKRLSTIGGSSVRNTTMNMLKYLLTNQVAMKFNWSGKDKKPFKKTKMCCAII
ncbi:hypothetical protein ILUMI_16916, partial [Ignelater luminosus]